MCNHSGKKKLEGKGSQETFHSMCMVQIMQLPTTLLLLNWFFHQTLFIYTFFFLGYILIYTFIKHISSPSPMCLLRSDLKEKFLCSSRQKGELLLLDRIWTKYVVFFNLLKDFKFMTKNKKKRWRKKIMPSIQISTNTHQKFVL